MNQAVHATSDPSQIMTLNGMMQVDSLKAIENEIKNKIKAMWKAGYSYVIICEYATNALGIQRCSQVMKAIAKIQHILDQINGDLNDFKKLLEELQRLGLPDSWTTKEWNGKYHWEGKWPHRHKEKTYVTVTGGPGKHTVWENMQQYSAEITAWLKKNNDLGIKGPDGKPLTNAQAFQHIWNDLFGTGKNANDPKSSKTCLLAQLKAAMNNPWYKQTDNKTWKALEALNTSAFKGTGKDWTETSSAGDFQQFLQGKMSSTDFSNIARTLMNALCNSYYKNNNVKPTDWSSWNGTDATIEDVTTQSDAVVQSVTTLTSTQSSDMSEFAQQLTGLVNVIQQMLQQNDKANSNFVNNQQGR